MYVCMCVKVSEVATCSEKTENPAINAFCDSDKGAFPAPSCVLLTTIQNHQLQAFPWHLWTEHDYIRQFPVR